MEVEIYDGASLLGTVAVDHMTNGGQWNVLGTEPYTFTGEAKVIVTSQGSCTTSADAVKIGDPPVEPATAPVAQTGQSLCYDLVTNQPIDCAGTGQDGENQNGVPSPTPRFTDNGDGTIRDNLTGLIWTADANLNNGQATWADALTFCNGLSAAHSGLQDGSVAGDWALPNKMELQSLIDSGEYDPALPSNYGSYFNNVQSSWYWSA
ncbi:MAG: DUF1566 domain-containing protein, partial [Gammaproteobacteria bacterium]|nr:DUF1566 domain-containing protein [Gammaproteobacteria bacterium]